MSARHQWKALQPWARLLIAGVGAIVVAIIIAVAAPGFVHVMSLPVMGS
ncbi:hypothetical protein AB4Z09_27745 [Rhodococcus sp. TAF43]